MKGKSELTIALYDHLIREMAQLGEVQVRPTKSAIALSTKVRFGHIHRLGKNFVDLVLYFDEAHNDNLCFYRIANVPGSTQHNHYFRMMEPEDVNEEVRSYIAQAMAASERQ
ncbi:MAG: hypothetical protein JNL72_15845 [Flavipsychrobacter sp.]|nr:hypothetical protein [Flavipsychrobacter sp.]